MTERYINLIPARQLRPIERTSRTYFGHSSSKTLSNASSTASSHYALVAAAIVRCNKDHGAMLVTAATAEITYQLYNTGGILIDDYTVAKKLCQLGFQDDSFRFIR